MSYMRFCSSRWIASIGINGMNALATSTENTLPKLELAVMLRYFMMLPKVSRPFNTPSSSTIRLFSQDDIGRLFGNVGAAVDRNPDVSIAQCRCVVNAIAEESDGMAIGLQGFQHP